MSNKSSDKKRISPRHLARAAAVQALYQLQLKHHSVVDVVSHTLEYYIDQKIDADYFNLLVEGVAAHQSALDDYLSRVLDRQLSTVTPVEMSVMRLAVYELQHCLECPAPVVINEALELAKAFGTDEGYKYINGVLDALLPQLRPHG